MAAGLGFKDFTTGEVLTAADVDGYLMQGIWVFASAAARDAAVTSPQEGNFAFLKDTNTTTYYTGSAWTNLDTTGMVNPMTTTGDTIYSSSGSTPARLGIGTAGQVLTVNSGATAPEWATPASGGMTLISTTTLTGASVTLSSIPSTYNNLYVVLTGATWGTDTDTLYFQPNNLTTNYGIVTRNKNATTSNDSLANEAITQRENILRTSVNNVHILEIQNYASASYFKAFRYHGYFEYSTTLPMAFTVAGGIRTNSAITSLVIKTSNGYTFSAGQVLLYGVK